MLSRCAGDGETSSLAAGCWLPVVGTCPPAPCSAADGGTVAVPNTASSSKSSNQQPVPMACGLWPAHPGHDLTAQTDRLDHARRIGAVLAGDVEGRTVIGGGAREREAERHVHAPA